MSTCIQNTAYQHATFQLSAVQIQMYPEELSGREEETLHMWHVMQLVGNGNYIVEEILGMELREIVLKVS